MFKNATNHGSAGVIFMKWKRCFSSSNIRLQKNYYEILELPHLVSIKDIKVQFKKLSKKYHPDLNSHLPEEEKKANSDKFVQIVTAYDTLKDIKKKKSYDAQFKSTGNYYNKNPSASRRNQEWQNKYYGEAKYYSKSHSGMRSSYSASGLNTKRHSVRHDNGFANESTFTGEHRNYGDRHGVPHFNYDEHLLKHLKFEQRIINRQLTDEDREAILQQLKKAGDVKNLSEELITKHLMRQVHHSNNAKNGGRSSSSGTSSSGSSSQNHNPYMYHGPQDDGDGLKMTIILLGAGGSLYLLYQSLFN